MDYGLKTENKILGIDPGYDRLGYALVNGDKLETLGCLETDRNKTYEERLADIGREFGRLVKKLRPDALAIEKLFLGKNKKTATKVAEVRGVILYLSQGLPVYEFSPPEIKLAVCGYGRADKKQVSKMIKMLYKINGNPKDDALDAAAIAFTAAGKRNLLDAEVIHSRK